MLTRLRRRVRRQIATAGQLAIVVLRLSRDGEAILELRRKRSKRGGITLNLSSAAARLIPGRPDVLPQPGLFQADAAPRGAGKEANAS